MFIVFLYCIITHSVPCEPNTTYEEQRALIEHLKEKTDIQKIKTFYCKYILLSEYFSNPRLTGKTFVENREIAWDNYFDKGNFLFASAQTIDVINLDINLVENGKGQDNNNEGENENINGDTEKSLISIIKSKLGQETRRPNIDYIDWSKIDFDRLTPIGKCYTESKYCRYKGKEQNVVFIYFDDGRTTTTKSTFLINWQDFYVLYAFLIVDLTPTGDNTFVKYITLGEFLDLPGPFHISKKDGYTILWHYTRVKRSSSGNSEYEIPISVDIWIDNNLDIYRIDFIHYYSRVMDAEKFHEGNWSNTINCEYPCLLEKRIVFDNYQTFNGNIRMPLHISVIEYETDTKTEEGKKLELDMRNGNISPLQYLFNITKVPRGINLKDEYFFDPNSIKVNQKLPKEIFRPPEDPPQDNLKSKTYKHNFIYIFVGGCILVVIIGIFITNRYFGWSI